MRLNVVLYGHQTFYAACTEGPTGVGEQVHRMQEIVNHHRLKHVQFKVALAPTHGDGSVVAHHLTADHGHGFGLGC